MSFSLAVYACDPKQSRGRYHHEDSCFMRDPLQRDRDRIIHSLAFRRLKHKTQVFMSNEGEYYRTRLTHSMEVAQIARGIARSLALNEDLAEAVSLAHDLGHAPFGHAGEDALSEAMHEIGGFNHNDQTFRVLSLLEKKYPNFDGLNLSWETLEGIVKHNGPIKGGLAKNPSLRTIYAFCEQYDLELETYPSAEAQIAALSDDIAYNSHDIDDGLKAGLFSLQDIRQVPLIGRIMQDIEKTYPNLAEVYLVHETIRRVINTFVGDMYQETFGRLKASGAQSAQDVRNLGHPVVALSDKMKAHLEDTHEFLVKNMYFHPDVLEMKATGRAIVRDLFTTEKHRHYNPQGGNNDQEVADIIATLTDDEALSAHEKLTGKKHTVPFLASRLKSAS